MESVCGREHPWIIDELNVVDQLFNKMVVLHLPTISTAHTHDAVVQPDMFRLLASQQQSTCGQPNQLDDILVLLLPMKVDIEHKQEMSD